MKYPLNTYQVFGDKCADAHYGKDTARATDLFTVLWQCLGEETAADHSAARNAFNMTFRAAYNARWRPTAAPAPARSWRMTITEIATISDDELANIIRMSKAANRFYDEARMAQQELNRRSEGARSAPTLPTQGYFGADSPALAKSRTPCLPVDTRKSVALDCAAFYSAKQNA